MRKQVREWDLVSRYKLSIGYYSTISRESKDAIVDSGRMANVLSVFAIFEECVTSFEATTDKFKIALLI